MHHALEIEEILLCIFANCFWPEDPDESDWYGPHIARLARTCRTFKEPALDVLWTNLIDLSPLSRCLPEASRQISLDEEVEYSFSRPLTQAEWDTLRSYTRRVRFIYNFGHGLDEDSLGILSNAATVEPLFPDLRSVCCKRETENGMRLLRLPLPSLDSLEVSLTNPGWFPDSFKYISESSPNIRHLLIDTDEADVAFHKTVCDCICNWRNLHTVTCWAGSLDVDTLTHLSHISVLTELNCIPSDTLPASNPLLVFSNLRTLILRSPSLDPVLRLLSWSQLPAITHLAVTIDSCPSEHHLLSFVDVVAANVAHTLESLKLDQLSSPPLVRSEASLHFEGLRPWMVFSNLCHMHLSVEWNVRLSESELLTLTSAWPNLQFFAINPGYGWNVQSGITQCGVTPDGLLRLLQTCRSLRDISLVMDTRGYTELPSSELLESLGGMEPRSLDISVLDSMIEVESVPAISAFLAGITPSRLRIELDPWCVRDEHPSSEVYEERWKDVFNRAIGQRDNCFHQ